MFWIDSIWYALASFKQIYYSLHLLLIGQYLLLYEYNKP